ncbi:hypothetical protein EZS27_015092 [termite gut metagenome]|uniref:Uncharacterized protein n=1 Tax=termite gut metagenome TaxID=433724 RepID=A0A5J4RTJ7_9ZZZZ
MRKKDIKAVFFGGIVLLSLFSCIDSKYDLGKDIDLTVLVGGEKLTLPVGSSEKMYLNKFIKVEDNELLDTLETGAYYLMKADTMNDTKVHVDSVEISDPTFEIEDIVLLSSSAGSEYPSTMGDGVSISVSKNGSFNVYNNDMPPEVIRVQSFDIVGEEYINISFEAMGLQSDDQIDLTALKITFPDFFIFKEGQKGLDHTTNTYTIGDNEGDAHLNSSKNSCERQLIVDRFYFRDDRQGWVDHETDEKGIFSVDGDLEMGGEIIASFKGDLEEDYTDDVRLGTKIVFLPHSFFIASISGKVDPKINIDTVKVELTEIPDFLNDDDARMDFANPEIRLHVENPFGLPILLNLDMQGWKNGKKTHNESIKVGGIKIPANPNLDQLPTPITIIISKLGAPENEEPVADTNYYKVSELGDLFFIIPDEMELNVEAHADQDPKEKHTIILGETEQVVKINYEVNLPLSFGENMSIVYKDTISGWNEDIKNFDIKRIDIEAEILNTIPLELSLSGYAIDVNGKKLDRLIVGIKDNAPIPPCNEDGSETTVSVVIEIVELVPAFSDNPTAIMKNLDGIVLNFTAKSTETINNMPLKNTQYMMLKGMKARIPGGVKLNMNE